MFVGLLWSEYLIEIVFVTGAPCKVEIEIQRELEQEKNKINKILK